MYARKEAHKTILCEHSYTQDHLLLGGIFYKEVIEQNIFRQESRSGGKDPSPITTKRAKR